MEEVKEITSNDKFASLAGRYYTEKFEIFGATPQGVDWNGSESQLLRFKQLAKVLDAENDDAEISLLDYGCGYGLFYEYIASIFTHINYTGYDVSMPMIEYASNKYTNVNWTTVFSRTEKYDYVVASGVFNVKQEIEESEWRRYVLDEIEKLNDYSHKGMAFNLLTSYSDAEKMKPHLFYADPCEFFDLCKRRYSRNVALLHDYNLYEFTIIVRK